MTANEQLPGGMLAQKLWGIQFNNVYVYKDGFPDWQAKGGQVHTGGNP